MSRWARHPAEVAQVEEASKHIPDEAISSSMVILGKHSIPHVYEGRDGRMWIRMVGRGVTLEVTLSPAQLRSIQGQAERVLLAHDLKDAS